MQPRQLQAFEQLCATMRDMAKEFLFPYYKDLKETGFTDSQAMVLVRDMQRMMLGETLESEEADGGED